MSEIRKYTIAFWCLITLVGIVGSYAIWWFFTQRLPTTDETQVAAPIIFFWIDDGVSIQQFNLLLFAGLISTVIGYLAGLSSRKHPIIGSIFSLIPAMLFLGTIPFTGVLGGMLYATLMCMIGQLTVRLYWEIVPKQITAGA